MRIKECTTSDSQWGDAFKCLPANLQDIYFSPSYYRVYEQVYGSQAHCMIFENDNDIALYPFIINTLRGLSYINIDHEYFDIQGAYGYNGVASTSNDPAFTSGISRAMIEYCQEKGIIAEFTRFNPVYNNHKLVSYLNVISVNHNVLVNLTERDIWQNSYEHSTRKNIKKAERSGLNTIVIAGRDVTSERLDSFIDIYEKTMTRNSADEFYNFPRNYFESMLRFNGQNTIMFFTIKDEIPIACELVLYGGSVGYSFLGGTLAEYYDCRPNDILKHAIIEHLKDVGCTCFCLGGGTTDGDGVFRYKRSFSKNGVVDFFIGKKIHNAAIYGEIVNAWSERFPEKCKKYGNQLLKYRY
ncbi:MAG: GNAT family N-acetyltransferase [Ignavibacteriales bacterium]|nr:GNAT family N-acetyltransferase [Ignavibacteriales bacterium]